MVSLVFHICFPDKFKKIYFLNKFLMLFTLRCQGLFFAIFPHSHNILYVHGFILSCTTTYLLTNLCITHTTNIN